MSYGLSYGLHFRCLSYDNPPHCVEPDLPHYIIYRDYEDVPAVAGWVYNHTEAEVAAAKIREYLEQFADDDTFIIGLMPPHGILRYTESINSEMAELRRQEEEDVRRS